MEPRDEQPTVDDEPVDASSPASEETPAASEDEVPDGAMPVHELLPERPDEARRPLRRPAALAGTAVTGIAMGAAEIVPGFSGGTVALVAGIYERLIAAIRQTARAASLLVRGRPRDAWRAVGLVDWPFVAMLLAGMLVTVFTLAGALRELLDDEPVVMSAVFLGLILGAAVVAARRLRAPRSWHLAVVVLAAVATFVALGFRPGVIESPGWGWFILGGAIAITAWILPGVSGSFLLVVLGLYPAVLGAVDDRQVGLLLLFAIGCGAGLAAFTTLLNWLLARAHDLVLAVLVGLMLGSARVLWPWPADDGFASSTELAAPSGSEGFLALAVGIVAFVAVYTGGLVAAAVERRRGRRIA